MYGDIDALKFAVLLTRTIYFVSKCSNICSDKILKANHRVSRFTRTVKRAQRNSIKLNMQIAMAVDSATVAARISRSVACQRFQQSGRPAGLCLRQSIIRAHHPPSDCYDLHHVSRKSPFFLVISVAYFRIVVDKCVAEQFLAK